VAAKITAAQDRIATSPQGRELADDNSCKMSPERATNFRALIRAVASGIVFSPIVVGGEVDAPADDLNGERIGFPNAMPRAVPPNARARQTVFAHRIFAPHIIGHRLLVAALARDRCSDLPRYQMNEAVNAIVVAKAMQSAMFI